MSWKWEKSLQTKTNYGTNKQQKLRNTKLILDEKLIMTKLKTLLNTQRRHILDWELYDKNCMTKCLNHEQTLLEMRQNTN
jgi:hypothetical protein